MKIIYSVTGTILVVLGLGGAFYLFNKMNGGADMMDTITIISFGAVIPFIFGILLLTIPENKINKISDASLWILLGAFVVFIVYLIAAYMIPEGGLIIVPVFTLLAGILFMVAFALFLVGRFKKTS